MASLRTKIKAPQKQDCAEINTHVQRHTWEFALQVPRTQRCNGRPRETCKQLSSATRRCITKELGLTNNHQGQKKKAARTANLLPGSNSLQPENALQKTSQFATGKDNPPKPQLTWRRAPKWQAICEHKQASPRFPNPLSEIKPRDAT